MKHKYNKLRTVTIAAILAVTAMACTPKERLLWDEIHNLQPGSTHAWLCENDPTDPYCDGTPPTYQEIVNYVFKGQEATASRIVSCESEWDASAVSHTNDHGLFQINETIWNKPWHSDPVAQYIGGNWHDVYDAHINARMAKKLVDHYGWYMWSCW